ncbi:ABC transporter permease [Pinirhizobacter sp.]|jgi:putative ABC transport system permease protein|uniref:ABC transporter permease n=1 Tax=Pinirhizobacter sp. TaxID=2950432 RepID=UPI002F41D305
MFGYYLGLALRSFRGSRVLTALIIVLMGVGVATCMVAWSVFRVTAADPLPGRSATLFVPQVDNFGPTRTNQGEPPNLLSHADAMALWHARGHTPTTLLYPVSFVHDPDDGTGQPSGLDGDAVTRDFFAMFGAPFAQGHVWSQADDEDGAALVVISDRLNRRLFGGDNSIGRSMNLDGHAFRVVGVLGPWQPWPRFYDVASTGTAFIAPGDIYLPLRKAIALAKRSLTGYCSAVAADPNIPDFNAWVHSECVWIGAWVQLRDAADVARYRQFLVAYATTQQQMGRFAWEPNIRLTGLNAWLASQRVIPKATNLSMMVALSFLLIAMVNVVGLMLARFMRRSTEIGVRRALGASRAAIYRQFGTEAVAIGMAGALLGMGLTWLGIRGVHLVFEPTIAAWAHMDLPLMLGTVVLAVGATFLAALYPTWRAAQVQPAWQIKTDD